jgi:anti-anti-sigma factor
VIHAPSETNSRLVWKELFVMGRDLAVSAVRTRKEGGAEACAADRAHTALEKNTRAQAGASEPHLALADANVWTHTLVLTGELDRRSAHTLEVEIERLCEEGVTGITLDLRGLAYIDWIGVAVIAFRCDHCKRRGYEFGLIPGSPSIQFAFEQAGVSDSLPFQHEDSRSHSLAAS